MKKALILHGWFETPDGEWFSWLKKELEEKGYQVFVPFLKDNAKPTLTSWTNSVKKELKEEFNNLSEFLVIGHSLGVGFGLKLLEKYKVKKFISVSGWDYWDLTPEHKTFFNPPINHKKILKNCKNIVAIHSNNDPYVTEFVAGEYAKRVKGKFIVLKNKGHFLKKDGVDAIPEMIKEI